MICGGCRYAADCAGEWPAPCPDRVVEMHLMECTGCDCQHRLPSTYRGCEAGCETECAGIPHAEAVAKYLQNVE